MLIKSGKNVLSFKLLALLINNKSTEDLRINKLKVNEELRLTGKQACAFRVSSHLYV